MSEIPNPKYELSPAGLRARLDDICVDYLAYTKPSAFYRDTVSLLLDTPNGERVIIEKAVEGTQPEGNFFQDMDMSIHPGTNRTFNARQVDFNFNQFGDGQLRKRVISGEENSLNNQPVTPDEVAEAMGYLNGASVIDPHTGQPVGVVS